MAFYLHSETQLWYGTKHKDCFRPVCQGLLYKVQSFCTSRILLNQSKSISRVSSGKKGIIHRDQSIIHIPLTTSKEFSRVGGITKPTHLFFSTLKRVLASFLRLSLVFMLIQNSTANSSTNFLFINRRSLMKINRK